MRILIVEDSVTMRKVMEMTFAGEDAQLLTVESGELALQHGRDFGPDVAFVDASLPTNLEGHFLLWYTGDAEGSVTPNRIGLAKGWTP